MSPVRLFVSRLATQVSNAIRQRTTLHDIRDDIIELQRVGGIEDGEADETACCSPLLHDVPSTTNVGPCNRHEYVYLKMFS